MTDKPDVIKEHELNQALAQACPPLMGDYEVVYHLVPELHEHIKECLAKGKLVGYGHTND